MKMYVPIQKCNNIQSFNINVIIRILKALSDNGTLNMTNLAMYSCLNYTRCKKYLCLMKALNWISLENDDRNMKITCTANGKKIMRVFFNFIQEKDF